MNSYHAGTISFELFVLIFIFPWKSIVAFEYPRMQRPKQTQKLFVNMMNKDSPFKVAILGASGYTGSELMRLLVQHQHVQVSVLTADRSAGLEFKNVYPQYSYLKGLPKLSKWEDSSKEIESCDVAFCCLPHGTTQEIINHLASKSKVKVQILFHNNIFN